jgi:aerobic-type carbon monoxide dehydrogenase small subunit (CoxS/CutS family)
VTRPEVTASREVTLTVNGRTVSVQVPARELLVDTLRDRLGLTGAHPACGTGVCGACAVLLDGAGVRSCLMFTVQADSASVLTVEGLGSQDAPHPVQAALSRRHGLQCGYCTPGVVVTAVELIAEGPQAGDEETRREQILRALSGSLCRCTGYAGIVAAICEVLAESGER